MDFEKISLELNNKNIVAHIDRKSSSFEKFGPRFMGRLVGRTIVKCDHITKTVISLTILSAEYLTYKIPCEDIQQISENLLDSL
jgi:hypothetical protein